MRQFMSKCYSRKKVGSAAPIYSRLRLQYNHEHAMTGPIVGHGQLIGMVHFARTSGYPAFDAKDLANLSALCAHLSAQRALYVFAQSDLHQNGQLD